MKKLIYSLATLLVLSCAFVSCGSDDDENISYSTTPEKASAGTYVGTWTRVQGEEVTTYDGSVTLAATDSVGCVDITFSCPETEIAASSVANITNANYGFKFVNQVTSAANGLGTSFSGNINENGVLFTAFTLSVRTGRVLVEYEYSFVGTKQ